MLTTQLIAEFFINSYNLFEKFKKEGPDQSKAHCRSLDPKLECKGKYLFPHYDALCNNFSTTTSLTKCCTEHKE